jgi:hypothetical protein
MLRAAAESAVAEGSPAVTKALLEHLVQDVRVTSRQHIVPTFRLPGTGAFPPVPDGLTTAQVLELPRSVPPAGLEPAAKCLEGTCSIH